MSCNCIRVDGNCEKCKSQPLIVWEGGVKFHDISLVKADIKSKWQAHFFQIFPINEVYDKLPATHESDKEILERYQEKKIAKETFNTLIEDCL